MLKYKTQDKTCRPTYLACSDAVDSPLVIAILLLAYHAIKKRLANKITMFPPEFNILQSIKQDTWTVCTYFISHLSLIQLYAAQGLMYI